MDSSKLEHKHGNCQAFGCNNDTRILEKDLGEHTT